VLEVGTGIGTMLHRLLEWEILRHAHYTAIDADPDIVGTLPDYLARWAHDHDLRLSRPSPARAVVEGDRIDITVVWECIDLFDLTQHQQTLWDLLLAHALLDLVDLPRALNTLLAFLRPGGLFYFTLNFDGMTVLEPVLDPALDATIMALYHDTMDIAARGTPGRMGSCTGRRLLTHLHSVGAHILEAGSSDWIICPRNRGYTDDETFFLHFIIHTIDTALRDHPDLDPVRFRTWVQQRHGQVTRCELIYIAHQLDVLGRSPRGDVSSL